MKVRFTAGLLGVALASSMLLAPAGSASNTTERTETPAASKQGPAASRDGSPSARKVKVIFVKSKKHRRWLNRLITRKRHKFPRCTRAVHVWRKRAATYSCCAKCKVESPKDLRNLPRFRKGTFARGSQQRGWCWLPGRCIQTYGWFSEPDRMFRNPWARVNCTVAIAASILPVARAAIVIKKAGGVRKFVTRLGKAESENKIDAVLAGIAEYTGVKWVKSACSKW